MPKEKNKTVGEWSWNSEVLWSKIVKTGTDDCWAWLGAVGPQTNLFGARKNGKPQMTQTQRILYREVTGEDCDDLQIQHSCGNAYCLNPDHFQVRPNQRKYRLDGTTVMEPRPPRQQKPAKQGKLVAVSKQTRWWKV